jgi:hypothetical protein
VVRDLKTREQASQANPTGGSSEEPALNSQRIPDSTSHSADSRNRQTNYRRNLRPDNSCRKCKQIGHWARECPLNRNSIPPNREECQPIIQPTLQTNLIGTGSSANEVYLHAELNGQRINCLLDTGCDMSVIGSRLLPNCLLEPTKHRLLAANHTNIPVVGETTIILYVDGKKLSVRVVVSEIMDDLVLGIDWLRQYRCRRDFGKNLVEIDGNAFRLHGRSHQNQLRRIYIAEDTLLPSNQQQEVPVVITLPTLREISDNWVTEPKTVSSGVVAASTLVSNRTVITRIPGINSTREERFFKSGQFLSVARVATEIVSSPMEELRVGTSEMTGKYIVANTQGSTKRLHTIRSEGNKEMNGEHGLQHLFPILDSLSSELSTEEEREAKQFIMRYADIFSKNEFDIGRTDVIRHSINTSTNTPVRQPLRRHPIAQLPVIDQHVEKMLKHDIIEPVSSPWASNVVLVRKQDGSLRFCVDYRQLNSLTLKDAYPLPRIDSCLDSLGGAIYFSTLDLRSGYWQTELDEATAEKTTFETRKGSWKFKVLPFGLCNAPASFQRLMDMLLVGLTWQSCLVYLDDIIVFSNTFEQHVKRLDAVFQRIKQANMKLNVSKCKLFRSKVHFLGHVISQKGIEPDPSKTEAVRTWKTPQTLTELRAFVGLANYYRRHIKSFAEIARPLHELTKKGVIYKWSESQQRAFEQLKLALTTAPVLAIPRERGRFVVDTDASNEAVGAVIHQEQEGILRVLAYASRALSTAEKSYCTTRKELLAIIYSMKQFRHFLLGTAEPFELRTDHAALTSLLKSPEPVGQQARWLDLIAEYNFKIIHRAGRLHGNSDALSRRPCQNNPGQVCRQCVKKGLEESEENCYNEVEMTDETYVKILDNSSTQKRICSLTVIISNKTVSESCPRNLEQFRGTRKTW